ncbi:MAG TPA: glycosyltransferase family 4 protein [Elusimicrobiota bacterium]|nr:glycosyltransferase family 4 protein [Elusimicrobiota bacterium]
MPKIKIAHLTVGLGAGGTERLVTEMAISLNPALFDVHVLVLKKRDFRADLLEKNRIPVTFLNGRNCLDLSVIPAANRFFKDHSFDIVHSHLIWANSLAASLKGRNKLIWHDHDTGESMRWFDRAMEKLFVGKSDRIVAISDAVAQRIALRCPAQSDRVRVIHNAIRLDVDSGNGAPAAKPPFQKTGPVVGYLGRLDEPKKGVAVLIRAWPGVLNTHPSAQLVIVGDGAAALDLEILTRQLGLQKSVRFLGEQSDVKSHLAAFDIFVLPSLWEGFGISLLEAMSSSLPVVATRVGGIPEVVADGETGLLVPPGNVQALGEAVSSLLSDPVRAQDMGKKGLARVRGHFDMKMNISQLEKLYQDCMGRHD